MNNIKNADLPVTPLVNEHGHPFHASHIAFENTPLTTGLSKREAFAMAAMQGLLAEGLMMDTEIAKDSLMIADALLAELEK